MAIKVNFKTNLDDYNSSDFQDEVLAVPRKDEYIEVKDDRIAFFKSKNLPTRLKVVSVTHTCRPQWFSGLQPGIEVELWYHETDYKLYFPNGLENRR